MRETRGNATGGWSAATAPGGAGVATQERSYLVVLDGDHARTFVLPQQGEVVVGRGETADLRLSDPAISRTHARLTITPAETDLTDLGGPNGTWVNGERLVGTRALLSGDEISVCGATLVYHAAAPSPASRLVPLTHFQRRVGEELERALCYRRPASVVAVKLGPGAARSDVAKLFEELLRSVDVATFDGDDTVLVLLAETGLAPAREAAQRFVDASAAFWPKAKAGVATHPDDGSDTDSLLTRARRSARTTQAGRVGGADPAESTLVLGERRIVVDDPAMRRLYELLGRLAKGELPVLLLGETGTGKDIAANVIHESSRRRRGPFVAINCAAVPESLVESELFGHERGAFSGALAEKTGLIATASGGTLFLDEVGELPLQAQAKLLRVLETKQLLPVGAVKPIAVDVRVVAATNRDPEAEIDAGRFRRDLYFRIRGASLWIPPLRNRKSEIVLLAELFLEAACARADRPRLALSQGAITALRRHPWPGNIRELQSVMEYAAGVITRPVLEATDVAELLDHGRPQKTRGLLVDRGSPASDAERAGAAPGLAANGEAPAAAFRPIDVEVRELEARRMVDALAATNGNRTKAAQLIDMPRRTFVQKLRDYGLMDAVIKGRRTDDDASA